MSVVAFAGSFLTGAARLLAPPRREFRCGDCARWQRCGLPPDPKCAEREARISQYEELPSTRFLPAEFLPFR